MTIIAGVTKELLIECHERGIALWIDDGRLVFGAYSKIPPEFRAEIERNCNEIAAALRMADTMTENKTE